MKPGYPIEVKSKKTHKEKFTIIQNNNNENSNED